jgi:hypothetical protein
MTEEHMKETVEARLPIMSGQWKPSLAGSKLSQGQRTYGESHEIKKQYVTVKKAGGLIQINPTERISGEYLSDIFKREGKRWH